MTSKTSWSYYNSSGFHQDRDGLVHLDTGTPRKEAPQISEKAVFML